MASTTGLVQKIIWSGTIACVQVGPASDNFEIFVIELAPADPVHTRAYKRSMLSLLRKAYLAGYPVTVVHPDNSAQLTSVGFGIFDISPTGPAVHSDFYSIAGKNIPQNAKIVFDSSALTVTITPDLVRPHWVYIEDLDKSIPVGRNTVRLEAPGWSSDEVPVEVYSNPSRTVRTLYTGAPKGDAYTVALIGNPSIESTGGTFSTDPVMTNFPAFRSTVSFCLTNLLTVAEDLLRQDDIDRMIRFVTVFDTTRPADDANSLAHEIDPNLMETRRDRLNAFLNRYRVKADVVFVIHGSTTHDRATAWFTTDDSSRAGTNFTYDGGNEVHGHFAQIPGSAAVPITMDTTGLTPIHEFGHAASDFNNGKVVDLYNDGSRTGLLINKKFRALNTAPVPVNFATFNGTNYQSDQNRDGLGYPAAWTSYHSRLRVLANPNLMDNYWLAGVPQNCRLDNLTYDWFTERLRSKIFR